MKRFFIVFSIIIVFKSCYTVMYTNEFVFRLKDEHNSEKTAKSIAEADGHCVYLGKVGNVPNFYRMYCRPRVRKRSILFQNETFLLNVQSKFEVSLLERQKLQYRVTRSQDPQWTNLWYLKGAVSPSMNVESAWNKGKTGKNVVVGVVDDGIYMTHPDIDANIDVANSYDYYAGDADANPSSSSFSHGTKVSGLIAAEADNNECTIGVAYNSTLIGIRLLGSTTTTDSKEASSLSHNTANIDIYVNSWGPNDGSGFEGPGTATLAALQNGVNTGRSGKGSIYVWAAGNGGTNDHCNGDGYASSRYVTTITAVTSSGTAASYDEVCSTVFAAVYSGDGTNNLISTIVPSGCASDLQGTSYSVPIAAGIIALTLEANPLLTWRDIQHLIVYTSNQHTLSDDYSTWQKNGAQKYVSQVLGFGLMDADAMVTEAGSWINVPTQISCDGTTESSTISLETVSMDAESPISSCTIQYLETVSVDISLSYSRYRGLILLTLISPSGTESQILSRRPSDAASTLSSGSLTWTFSSIHFWGEEANGLWTLRYRKTTTSMTASVISWKLKLYGTASDPLQGINKCTPAPCNNNGTCIDRNYGYTCNCSSGYTGDTCDTSLVTPLGNEDTDKNGISMAIGVVAGIMFVIIIIAIVSRKRVHVVPLELQHELIKCQDQPFDEELLDIIFDNKSISLKEKLVLSVHQAKKQIKIWNLSNNEVHTSKETLARNIYDRFLTHLSKHFFPEYSLVKCIPNILETFLLDALHLAIGLQKDNDSTQKEKDGLSSLATDLLLKWEQNKNSEGNSSCTQHMVDDFGAAIREQICKFYSSNEQDTDPQKTKSQETELHIQRSDIWTNSNLTDFNVEDSDCAESECSYSQYSDCTDISVELTIKQIESVDTDAIITNFADKVKLQPELESALRHACKLDRLFSLVDVIFESELSLEKQVSYSVTLAEIYHNHVCKNYKEISKHMKKTALHINKCLRQKEEQGVQRCMNKIPTNFFEHLSFIKTTHCAMKKTLEKMVNENIKTEDTYSSWIEIETKFTNRIRKLHTLFRDNSLSSQWDYYKLEYTSGVSNEDIHEFHKSILLNFCAFYTERLERWTPKRKLDENGFNNSH